MKVIKFDVDLIGPEALINGRKASEGQGMIEAKIFMDKIDKQQQWEVVCAIRKLATEIYRAYRVSQVKRGEITPENAKRLGIDI